MIVVICGVSGSGKTTVGRMLAERLGCEFLDADDYHSADNIAKMTAGHPLNDSDREGWLAALRSLLDVRIKAGTDAVLACSALKAEYRRRLHSGCEMIYFLLDADPQLIAERVRARKEHFFSPSLLTSQFEILDKTDLTSICVDRSVPEVVEDILSRLPRGTIESPKAHS